MITINGTWKDANEQPVHCLLTVKSKSTPLMGTGGVGTANTVQQLKTHKDTGVYQLILGAGVYELNFGASPTTVETIFEITVPTGTDEVYINEVTSSELTFVYAAPDTVWNGTLPLDVTPTIEGMITIKEISSLPYLQFMYEGVVYTVPMAGNFIGTGSPEGVLAAIPGSRYLDITDPTAPTQWNKITGTGNTGWL